MNQICEGVEAFKIRRIKIIAEQLYEKNGSFQRWELVRAAGKKKKDEINIGKFIEEIIIDFAMTDD